jgi:tetratricopeptide (TPR) repeat protein
MKAGVKNVIFVLFLIIANGTYAQYNKEKIDKLLEAINLVDDLEQGLKMADSAFSISKKAGYEEGAVRALLLKAVKFNNARQYEEAFRSVVNAESEVRKLNNPRYLALQSILKGTSYSNLGFFKEGKKTLIGSIPIARRITDFNDRHLKLANIYSALGQNNELAKGSLKKTFLLLKKSYGEYKKVQKTYPHLIAASEHNMGSIFLDLKQYDSARIYLNKTISTSDKFKFINLKGPAHNDLGELYYIEKKYDLSKVNYEKGLNYSLISKNSIERRNSFEGLSQVYTALGDKEKAIKYLQLSIHLSDSMALVDKAAVKTPVEYIVNNEQQQVITNRKNYFKYISVIGLLLFAVLFTLLYYRYKLAVKLKVSDAKMKDLMGKLAKNNDDIKFSSRIEELKEVVKLAVSNHPSFLLKFNEFDPGFRKKLVSIAPSLVATEMEFCALLRLNFETKEIARYTKCSVRAVEGKKYRIRKKLHITSEQDICLWMNELNYDVD